MNKTLKRAISGLAYVVIMWCGASHSKYSYSLLFFILAILTIYEMWKLRKGKSKTLALLYILTPFILAQVILINPLEEIWTTNLMLFIFLLTWTFDTFAYIIGVRFGKHKIIPSISPNKSWEGFLGGFIFTIIIGYFSYKYFNFPNIKIPILTSIILPITATLGDFIASHYKREANVKDTGNLIPGHGGILDRMDAFMITIPAIYILIKLI